MNEAFKNLMIFYCMDHYEKGHYAAVDKSGAIHVHQYLPEARNVLWRPTFEFGTGFERSIFVGRVTLPNDIDWTETLIELS